MDASGIMTRVLDLAEENVKNGGWPFSAIIEKNGDIIAEAVNSVHTSHDPSDHAEIAAIRKASSLLRSPDLTGCTMYVIGWPCPMCLGCILWSKIDRIIFATDVAEKDRALPGLPANGYLYERVADEHGSKAIANEQMDAFSDRGVSIFSQWNRRQPCS